MLTHLNFIWGFWKVRAVDRFTTILLLMNVYTLASAPYFRSGLRAIKALL